jgi:hypothetical protein
MPVVTVTFNPNLPQAQQISCNPDTTHVPYGNAQIVTWNLTGQSGAAFAANGISFYSSPPGTLSRVSDTQFQLSDDNTNQSGAEVDYPYGINITYNGQPYSLDPEVANDPQSGGGRLKYHPA